MMGIYKVNVSAYIEPIETFSLSERNKEMILDFLDYCFYEGLRETGFSRTLHH